ncbi:MAG: oligosaccharide flippase family protein [bacterium]
MIYAIATVLNRAVNIILLPIYTRYLTKVEYGTLEILVVSSNVLLIVMQFGLGSALFRNYLYKKNPNKKTLISTAYYTLAIISIIFSIILLTFSNNLSLLLFSSIKFTNALRSFILFSLFQTLTIIPMTKLRIEERSGKFALIAGANFLLVLLLNLLFIYHFNLGINGIAYANAIASLIFFIVYFIIINKDLILSFSFTELKDMFEFGIPLIPASLFSMILMMSDRYLVKYYLGLEKVAIFGVALRIGTIMGLAVTSFQKTWPAVMFKIAKEKNGSLVFARLFTIFILLLITFGMIIILFSNEIITIFTTPKYLEANSLIPFIIISFIFYGVNYFTSIGIQVKKKTYFYPIIIGIAAIINISLNIFLLPLYGIKAAAFSRFISFFILSNSILLISLKYYRIKYEVKKLIILTIISCFLGFIGYNLYIEHFILNIIIKFLLIVIFLITMILFNIINIDLIKKLKSKIINIANNSK